ncbi:MAG: two-component system response regulator [Candidatus Heimdallarchaeota archaeon]
MRILLVDDDKDLLLAFKKFLFKEGTFELISTTSPLEALRLLKERQFDVIVSDWPMPEINGFELFKRIRSENNTIPFILFTCKPREEVALEALNSGINRYIHKAGDPEIVYVELVHAIKNLIEHQRTREALMQAQEELRLVYRQRSSSFCRSFFHGMAYPVSIDFANISDHKKGRK